jgi:DNA-binding PadR family transcriptional regulator
MAPIAEDDPNDFLPLTPYTFHILMALARGDKHGYAIMVDVEKRTDGQLLVGPGTLYSSIKRMLEAGWIVESDERPDPALDDERRRYYRLTDLGLRVAQAEADRLTRTLRLAEQSGLLVDGGAMRLEGGPAR